MSTPALPPKGQATIRVVVDAMGGDHAPDCEVAGTLLAIEQLPENVEIVLVGGTSAITNKLGKSTSRRLHIVDAPDVVTMSDAPATIVKSRRESSLYVGVDLMVQGHADAFVSAGNTGAVMATATMMCGRIQGVSRPTIGSFFPTTSTRPTLVVDVGANVDSKPRYLFDYAVMGSEYYRHMMGSARPTVGLLNVGEEDTKGREVVREAYQLLKASELNFVGNVEGRDVLRGTVDVVVCDGFEGNIVLKFAESILPFLKHRFTEFAERGLLQRLAMGLFKPILKGALAGTDYQEYGGVPLLGINGVVIIGHGSSSAKAFANMIKRAVEVVEKDVNGSIRTALAGTASAKDAQ
ncbi:MAG: phosphate acyltransferase PlsX [Bradyrhizobiaceae bacterium]|nr:phosphate acyltransferase PlsX [Bradyrhizobiaceae bacterium]